MAKTGTYTNDGTIQPTDKLFGTNTSGSTNNYLISDLTTYFSGQIAIIQDEMPVSVYDPAGIEEQLVGLTSSQTLTNKTMDFSSGGTNTIVADASDIDYDNSTSGLTATDSQAAIDELKATITLLKSVQGWEYHADSEITNATQTFTTTPSKLLIDSEGSNTVLSEKPLELSEGANMWDADLNKITPINSGDSYISRVDLEVYSETGTPSDIIITLDIGGGGSPSNVIYTNYVAAGKSAPYNVSFSIPFFVGETFLSNGGQIFISTDSDSVDVTSRGIFISRISSGDIT